MNLYPAMLMLIDSQRENVSLYTVTHAGEVNSPYNGGLLRNHRRGVRTFMVQPRLTSLFCDIQLKIFLHFQVA